MGLSTFNKFIIAWVLFMFSLTVGLSLLVIAQAVLFIDYEVYVKMETFGKIIDISIDVLNPLKDFFICLSLIYLFWFQGTK